MFKKRYSFRLFIMEPPISKKKMPEIINFSLTWSAGGGFKTPMDSAWDHSNKLIKKKKAPGTWILNLSQMNR